MAQTGCGDNGMRVAGCNPRSRVALDDLDDTAAVVLSRAVIASTEPLLLQNLGQLAEIGLWITVWRDAAWLFMWAPRSRVRGELPEAWRCASGE